jgi:integrase
MRENLVDPLLPQRAPSRGERPHDEAEGSRTAAEANKKHLRPYFGGRRMATISAADVRAYVTHRQEQGAKNATINRELAALKRMFTLAIDSEKLLHRPKIAMLEERNIRAGFFEGEQFEDVRAKLPADLRGLVTFVYVTGWRIRSEVAPLQWRQVDRVAGTVRLEPGTTKNRAGRTFFYRDITELRDTIDEQWAIHEKHRKLGRMVPWVFPRLIGRTKGQPARLFRKAWLTACTKAGCPGYIPHDFRRTAVRNLVRAGVSEKVAMEMTGHKTRSVFERYNIVSPGDLQAASRKLNETLVRNTSNKAEPAAS